MPLGRDLISYRLRNILSIFVSPGEEMDASSQSLQKIYSLSQCVHSLLQRGVRFTGDVIDGLSPMPGGKCGVFFKLA